MILLLLLAEKKKKSLKITELYIVISACHRISLTPLSKAMSQSLFLATFLSAYDARHPCGFRTIHNYI
jgi:hypothetical protein